MNYAPLSDRILVRRIELGSKSESGIITTAIDVEDRGDTCFGRVVATGPGKQLDMNGKIPMTVKEGDIIVYSPRAPLKFISNGEILGLLRESDVQMIVSGDDINELDPTEVEQFESRRAEMAPKARVIA